jgi:DNA-binding HxlR family transcriptional regulator
MKKKAKKIEYRSDCPISTALDIWGDKWSLLIVRDMAFKGKNTYGDFLGGGEQIATNILADRLAMLERGGIILRQKHPESKAKILYTLSSKGVDLIPALVEIITWSEKYHDVHPQAREFAKAVKKDKVGLIEQLMSGFVRRK